MPKYTVGKTWWFKECSDHKHAGETIELPEEVAENYMHNEPGLLAPERLTTQARPSVVRSDKPKAKTKKAKK